MNSYDLSKVETPKLSDGLSPYMTYGGGQVLKINDIELKYSQNSHAPKAILHMETKPIEDPAFTPLEGAKGRVGKVACGIYMTTDVLKREFLQKMKVIATVLDLESEINKIRSDNFEKVVQDIVALLKGRYARYTICASEYPKEGGKIGITLNLPKFKFVEAEDADPSTITKFDITNPYHYKKIAVGAVTGSKYGTGGNTGTYASKYGDYPDHTPDNPADKDIDDLPF